MQATFTSNDLVIQKLSQILSYLRTGRTSKKLKKKDPKKADVRLFQGFAARINPLMHSVQ